MPDLYHISDEAYEHLIALAVEHNYIRENAIRNDGISRFLERLSYRPFVDTRPEAVKESDPFRLARRKVPYWAAGHVRKRRMLDLSSDALKNYCKIALQLCITNGMFYTGGPRWNSPTSITGATLEAIGIEWATPLSIPRELGERKKPILRGSSKEF